MIDTVILMLWIEVNVFAERISVGARPQVFAFAVFVCVCVCLFAFTDQWPILWVYFCQLANFNSIINLSISSFSIKTKGYQPENCRLIVALVTKTSRMLILW